MKTRDIVKRIRQLGGRQLRRGSSGHGVFVCSCGKHTTSIAVQRLERQVRIGTLKHIEADLAPCWGARWLRGPS
ncbi:MAG: hypothetical protein JSV86_05875 [Gemmatimonadota bacterium]|nr:MAG: hypothetical protein JSV86_05875 [Gemmatimonadota bacterium]